METMQFCHSCGMPLQTPMAGIVQGDYCGNCVSESGKLNSREAVQAGIAQWLMCFTPDADMALCLSRADHYLKAMPAWAEK